MSDKLVEFEGYMRSEEFVSNALGLRKALNDLDNQHTCDTPNYTDGPCQACAAEKFIEPKMPLLEWLSERYENCLRISAQKTGDDQKSWQEDAFYFLLAIKVIQKIFDSQAVTR